jgi:hypothetical protein
MQAPGQVQDRRPREIVATLTLHHDPEWKRELRAVVHEELAALAEHVDVAQVEEQLVARL